MNTNHPMATPPQRHAACDGALGATETRGSRSIFYTMVPAETFITGIRAGAREVIMRIAEGPLANPGDLQLWHRPLPKEVLTHVALGNQIFSQGPDGIRSRTLSNPC